MNIKPIKAQKHPNPRVLFQKIIVTKLLCAGKSVSALPPERFDPLGKVSNYIPNEICILSFSSIFILRQVRSEFLKVDRMENDIN